jgi:serine/threonine protein kinase
MKRGLGLGDVIADRFRLVGDIGQGGMGRVFEAVDLKHDRPAAVKVIYRALARDPEFRMRFEREAQAAERATHPHVLPVWDFGSDAGHLFLATPLCDTDVAAMVEDDGPLEVEAALGIIGQIAWALDWAHGRNVVHRDVKPENILIVTGPTQPHAYLADFGMAKIATTMTLTQFGTPAGLSPAYAAPEQWRGDRATAATDQYALAGTLYCCLVGHPPFWPMRRTEELREAHLHEEPPEIGGARDPRLESAAPALLRALEKDPGKRYATCGELCAAVNSAVGPSASDLHESALGDRADARAATHPEHPTSERLWYSAEQETEPELTPLRPASASAPPTPATDESAPSATVATPSPAIEQAAPPTDESRPPAARRRLHRGLAAVVAVAALAGLVAVLAFVLGSGEDDGSATVLPPVAIGTPTEDAFAAGDSVWFAGQDGSLRRVDASSGKPVGKPVPFDGAFRLAGAGSTLWTISRSGAKAAGVDASAADPKAHTVGLSIDPYAVAVGEGAAWIAANASGPRESGRLIKLDAVSGRIRNVHPTASSLIGLAAGHHAVWVLEENRGLLRRVSSQALTTEAEIQVKATSGSAVVADAKAVWVANGAAGQLLRIDPRSDDVVARIAVRATDDVALAAGGGAIWWIDKPRGTVSRIDAKDNRPVGSPLRVGGQAGGAAVSGHTLWVAMQSAPSVARVGF